MVTAGKPDMVGRKCTYSERAEIEDSEKESSAHHVTWTAVQNAPKYIELKDKKPQELNLVLLDIFLETNMGYTMFPKSPTPARPLAWIESSWSVQ